MTGKSRFTCSDTKSYDSYVPSWSLDSEDAALKAVIAFSIVAG